MPKDPTQGRKSKEKQPGRNSPDVRLLSGLYSSAQKISTDFPNTSRRERDDFLSNFEANKERIKSLIADDSLYPSAIIVLDETFRVAGKLSVKDRKKLLEITREVVLESLGHIENQISKPDANFSESNRSIKVVLGAVIGAQNTEINRLITFGLHYQSQIVGRTSQELTAMDIESKFREVYGEDDFKHKFGAFGAGITRGPVHESQMVGREIFKRTVGEGLNDGESVMEYYKRVITAKGIDADKAIAYWSRTTSNLNLDEDKDRLTLNEAQLIHFLALTSLDSKRDGSAKRLVDNFGIYDFARYPEEVLLDQDERSELNDRPYVVAVFARGDWNNAFFYRDEPYVLDNLHTQLTAAGGLNKGSGYDLRIIEVETGEDMVESLKRFNSKYSINSTNKIAGALIFGHGSESSLELGLDDQKNVAHLLPEHIEGVRDYFITEPPIVLISCKTGRPNGIGQSLASSSAVILRAPDEDTNIYAIKVTEFKNSGRERGPRLHFDVTYYSPSRQKLYISGREVDLDKTLSDLNL